MKVEFKQFSVTKNTVRFKELEEENPKIGFLYIQQKALKELGYNFKEDKDVVITVNIELAK